MRACHAMSRSFVQALLLLQAANATLVLNKCCSEGVHLIYENEMRCTDPDSRNASNGSETVMDAPKMWPRLSLEAVFRVNARPCSVFEHIIMKLGKPSHSLMPNGSLLLNLTAFGGASTLMLRPKDYCIDLYEVTSELYVIACPCAHVTCFRKCCGKNFDFVFHGDEDLCNETGVEGQWRALERVGEGTPHVTLRRRLPRCTNFVYLNAPTQRDEWHEMQVLPNGSAIFPYIWGNAALPGDRWCGERLVLQSEPGQKVLNTALLCPPDQKSELSPRLATYVALLLVGAFGLALTLAIYTLLPELRARAHGKALMAHCAALLVAYLALAGGMSTTGFANRSCRALGLTIQFFFLTAFFWLNVLCYDMSRAFTEFHWTLRDMRATQQRRFLFYSIYACGSPLLITIITTVIVEMESAGTLPSWVVKTNMAVEECWFRGRSAQWAYYNGPLAVLMAVNAVLFASTVAQLVRARRESSKNLRGAVRHGPDDALSNHKRRLTVFSKMFLLMGLTWVVEAAAPLFAGTSLEADSGSFDVWVVADAVNLLRGVFIFVIYCCKAKVLHALWRRIGEAWGLYQGSAKDESYSRKRPTFTSSLDATPCPNKHLGDSP